MIEQVLRNIGLTEGEIKVYIALLELGTTTTWNLTKKSGISGSKVYEVLDRLAKKDHIIINVYSRLYIWFSEYCVRNMHSQFSIRQECRSRFLKYKM